jgi:aryl-alcohol dehydrogenase-like predicted oxidoreductase
MPRLGRGTLDVFGLCLGGNVFGWTADERASFAVLDAYVAGGGNFVDTADQYSAFVPGNVGGESETIIGRWMHARGNRADVVLASKVGKKPGRQGLAPANIRAGIEESLRRLQTDYVDLYYAHIDDPDTPLEETLGTFDALVREGNVRHIAASNYEAPRLALALAVSDREGLARYVALQTHYNLVERERYEGPPRDLCAREELACLPYWALARGFLTGKYRPGGEVVDSPRAGQASAYLDDRGLCVLGAPRRRGRGARHDPRGGRDRLAARPADGRHADRQRAQRRAAGEPARGRRAGAERRRARAPARRRRVGA